MKALQERLEDKATASNLNSMDLEEIKRLAGHIRAKYGHRLIETAHDRLELWEAGMGCDYILAGFLRQAGITV